MPLPLPPRLKDFNSHAIRDRSDQYCGRGHAGWNLSGLRSVNGYGQGAEGYGKRFGAIYGDVFIGTFIDSAILPTLLHQDPRYFYRGPNSEGSRFMYAIGNAVICKGDNKGISQTTQLFWDRSSPAPSRRHTIRGAIGGRAFIFRPR